MRIIMKEYSDILLNCPLFKNIQEEELIGLLSCLNSHIKSYENDGYIFFSGDTVNFIGIVLSGRIEVIKENISGSRHIMTFLGPSQIFAEGIVCTQNRISPVTTHVKESTKILSIPYEKIIKSCGNSCSFHIQLINNMITILGEKNMSLNSKIELLTIKSMREKLATYLLQESQFHNSLTFQIHPNRNELAEYLNVSRTSMCRELARMKELHILDYYQNSFKILSLEGMKNCLIHD